MAYKQRLVKLEKGNSHDFAEIRRLIRQGKYYDELSEEQKADYEEYKGSLGGAAVDIASAKLDILFNETSEKEAFHFKLSKREPPPTKEEFEKRINEIHRYLLEKE